MQVIDTHAHFWNVENLRYPWRETGSLFDRTFSLEDYLRASAEARVPLSGMIFIEADADPSDRLG